MSILPDLYKNKYPNAEPVAKSDPHDPQAGPRELLELIEAWRPATSDASDRSFTEDLLSAVPTEARLWKHVVEVPKPELNPPTVRDVQLDEGGYAMAPEAPPLRFEVYTLAYITTSLNEAQLRVLTSFAFRREFLIYISNMSGHMVVELAYQRRN